MDSLRAILFGGDEKQSVITDALLDRLEKVESGGNPKAINKESGAMGAYQFMPSTVDMLAKQGIKFDPMNRDQSREAARAYLTQLAERHGGDINKALKDYGGFKTKDPTNYINKVLANQTEPKISELQPAEEDNLRNLIFGTLEERTSKPIESAKQETRAPVQSIPAPTSKPEEVSQQPERKVLSFGEYVKGAPGAAIATIYNPLVQAAGGVVGIVKSLPELGSGQAPKIAEQAAQEFTKKYSYEPATEAGKEIVAKLGEAFEASKLAPVVTPEMTVAQQASKGVGAQVRQLTKGAGGQLAEQFETKKTTPTSESTVPAPQFAAGSVGAAQATSNPFKNKLTGEENVRGQFPQVKLSKSASDVPLNEQQTRAQILQELMPDQPIRPGVVTGNENTLRNEYAKANSANRTPEGELYKQQFAAEQNALSNFAEERVNKTGASTSLINDEQRGGRINDVFYGSDPNDAESTSIIGYLNQAKRQIYDSAFEKSGNNRIKTNNTDSFFNNPQVKATFETDNTLNVLNGAKNLIELAKTVGFELPDGTIAPPGSVAAFVAVIKSLNSNWSMERAVAIRKIKQAIDKDIAAAADPSLYKLGDEVHKLEKTLLGSRGISNLFGEVDSNGVMKSSTPLEKIPSKLNNMPKDQWRHIRDTLEQLSQGRIRNAPQGLPPIPAELQQAAKAALAEVDGALAREVYKAGASNKEMWNYNATNNVLNSVIGQKILEVFPPDEVRKFHVLNYAGHLMPTHGYEGAGLQAQRIGLIEANLPKVGAVVGGSVGSVGGPAGAGIGTYLGQKLGERAAEARSAKKLEKQAKEAQRKMEQARDLAKQTGENKLEDLGNK